VDAQTLIIIDMRNKGDNAKNIIELGVALVEQNTFQCKLDFHVLMLETFKGLFTIVEIDHVKVLVRNAMVAKT
jgi:hypothetical protein